MAHADDAALQPLLPLLRQLREIRGLREMKNGIFYLKGTAFLHFHVHDAALVADLKKAGGSGFDRYQVGTPPQQRKLVEDARRRVERINDSD